jgi:hypothetical protein
MPATLKPIPQKIKLISIRNAGDLIEERDFFDFLRAAVGGDLGGIGVI